MKKIWLLLVALPVTVLAGTLTIYQTIGQTTGQVSLNAFSGIIPAGKGMLQVGHGPFQLVANNTYFQAPGVTVLDWAPGPTTFTKEIQGQFPYLGGTLSGLYMVLSSPSSGPSITVRVRINGINGNEVLSIPAGTTQSEWRDTVHTDVISAGAFIDYIITTGATGSTLTATAVNTVFQASSNNSVAMVGSDPQSAAGSTTNVFAVYYSGMSGLGLNFTNQTELNSMYKMGTGGTWSNLSIYVTTNTLSTGNVVVRLRKNGANGSEVITIPSGAANGNKFYTDSTHTDSTVAGDTVCYSITMPGSGSGTFGATILGTNFTTTDNTMEWPAITGGHSFSAGDSNIIPIMGGAGYDASEVGDYAVLAQQAGTLSNMKVHLESGGNLNQIVTINMRKNGANCGPVITASANNGGGYIEDTTDTCTFLSTDELDYKETVPAGTGSIPWDYLGAKFTHQ